MTVQAAMAHSTGGESDQQKRNLQMYWYEILQTAASGMSAKLAAPLRELPRREKGDEDRRRWVRSQPAGTQAPRIASSSSSSGMEVLDAEAARRGEDKAKRPTSRSPRGRRGHALTREL